jgi:hypothetical protein
LTKRHTAARATDRTGSALEYNMSVAVPVGFIALTEVAVEAGVVMLIDLDQALAARAQACAADLLPIMWSTGAGSETMRRTRPRWSAACLGRPFSRARSFPAPCALVKQRHPARRWATAAPGGATAGTLLKTLARPARSGERDYVCGTRRAVATGPAARPAVDTSRREPCRH